MAKKNATATLPTLTTSTGVIVTPSAPTAPARGRRKKGGESGSNADAPKATRIGESVNLIEWAKDAENIKDESIRKEVLAGEQKKDDAGRVTSLTSENWTLTLEVAKRKVPATKEGKLYEMEYAALLPRTASAAVTVVENNLDVTLDKDGNELPSVLKYFRQGFGMLARNNAGASIASQVEGPEKARERTIVNLMKHRGWSREKAEQKYELLMADD